MTPHRTFARNTSFPAPTFQDSQTGTLIFSGQVPVEIGGLNVVTPRHGQLMPLLRGVRDPGEMRRYTSYSSFVAPVYQDAPTGTLILGGLVPVEIGGLNVVTPPHGRLMPLLRGVRDPAEMMRYARFNSFVGGPFFQDSQMGTLIFSGSSADAKTVADAITGTLIFSGSSVDAKIGTDALTGTLILAGSAVESNAHVVVYVDAATGALILAGSSFDVYHAIDRGRPQYMKVYFRRGV